VSADRERESVEYQESKGNSLEMRKDKVVGVSAGFATWWYQRLSNSGQRYAIWGTENKQQIG